MISLWEENPEEIMILNETESETTHKALSPMQDYLEARHPNEFEWFCAWAGEWTEGVIYLDCETYID